MGDVATPETLLVRWEEMVDDPLLQHLPYKIELNAWGKVEMGPPAGVGHARHQAEVAAQLREQLRDGIAMTECPVLTDIGVRVPDAAWASHEFMERHKGASPLPRAPEICVEVVSQSNVQAEVEEKTRAYLAAGAIEVWLVAESGAVRCIDASGERPRSSFPITLSLPDLSDEYR